ncbi:putative F420-0 ABC transporter substrate-binding protein [Homoserinibacter sp. GY 40078]|uniref:putative F420-0 ABC transporter substrate-binding protein n=1 Tax=Homoserinibacter sp. GY 40078 TaxID=2603275 RepID=UPI0011C96A1F|nr:putative F420-0 ABC transporter substrate-binding protein [Homoserinibacter sp. GY 40078]TXK16993.1 putative F420-0 ABC transporter substrate-binding protein [Homoserinibacter sp. GY 40078]
MSLSRRSPRTAILVRTGVVAVALVALAGCSTVAAEPAASPSTDAAVSIENCGYPVTFESAPQKVVAIKSTSVEMMLALGVGDRIVGTAFTDGPVPEKWADEESAPELSAFMPNEESVLELEPDVVYSGWESAFAADAAGTREELESLGVASYVQPAACRSTGVLPKLTFDQIFSEIEEAASIFRVDPSELLAEQQATLDAIQPDTRGLTALWYSSGDDIPYVGAGLGAPELILETAGLTNIAADVENTWDSLGWEAIIAADPDVIVLVDASWNTAADKITRLESNPATAELTAVKNKAYVTVPFPAGEAGVRTVDAAASVAEQVAELP